MFIKHFLLSLLNTVYKPLTLFFITPYIGGLLEIYLTNILMKVQGRILKQFR